jgi:hypothetical protein
MAGFGEFMGRAIEAATALEKIIRFGRFTSRICQEFIYFSQIYLFVFS